MAVTFKIVENNKDQIMGELEEAIERALEAVGMQAEAYTKAACSAVDTGLLRNSITYALAGKPANTSTYSADNAKPGKQNTGAYSGVAPFEKNTVYVGTNVEYAPYVEYGHSLPSGGHVAGIHFLQNGVMGHSDTFTKLVEQALKGF